MRRFWTTAIPVALTMFAMGPCAPQVRAQHADMAACSPGWEWNENSLKQDPCGIASFLETVCRGTGPLYNIPSLNSTQSYAPTQASDNGDTTCECNTVVYSLYMACSSCQGAQLISWPEWVTHCDSVFVAQYPYNVPPGTAVPRWAFYDVTNLPNQTYSDSVAMSVGRDPEASPRPIITLSVASSTPSVTSSAPHPAGTRDNSGNKIKTGVIVGAVLGSVTSAIIIVAILVLCYQRRRRDNVPTSSRGVSEYYKGHPTLHPENGYRGQGRYLRMSEK